MTTRGWLAAGLWVSATAAATVVSFAIVGGVSGRVVTADVSAPPTATADRVASSGTTAPTTASAPAPVTSTSASPPPGSASPASPRDGTTAAPASPSTTQPPTPSASPTTAPPPATVHQTYTVQGGILTVTCTGSSIALDSATPSDGYRLRVDRTGPDRVEVRFESDGGGSRVEATCVDGHPSADIEPEGGSGGPGDDGSGDGGP